MLLTFPKEKHSEINENKTTLTKDEGRNAAKMKVEKIPRNENEMKNRIEKNENKTVCDNWGHYYSVMFIFADIIFTMDHNNIIYI